MIRQLICLARGVAIAATVPSFVLAQDGTNKNSLPLKHDPKPTSAAISAGDLMTRLYIFADDSMMGRETGTRGHLMSTAYIANELRRLGLKPAGDGFGRHFGPGQAARQRFERVVRQDRMPLRLLQRVREPIEPLAIFRPRQVRWQVARKLESRL